MEKELLRVFPFFYDTRLWAGNKALFEDIASQVLLSRQGLSTLLPAGLAFPTNCVIMGKVIKYGQFATILSVNKTRELWAFGLKFLMGAIYALFYFES